MNRVRGGHMRKKIKFIVLGIVLVFFAINIGASFFFYNLAIDRNVKEFLQGNNDLEVSAEALEVFLDGDWRDWSKNQNYEVYNITSYDGLELQGYYLPAKEPTHKLVILSHGYLGHAKDMALYGQHYYEDLGYNIFFADARGHGQSEGDYIGFGWHDRLDLTQWIDTLVEKLGEETEIILHGLSMGAASVLMTAGEELPDNVKGIIADSPYTSVWDMFDYQITRMFHLPAFPVLHSTSALTKIKAGYTFGEASALEQVKKANLPILYIHGETDTFVPTELAWELYENTSSEAEIYTFPDAGHGEAFVIHKDAYLEILENFLDSLEMGS